MHTHSVGPALQELTGYELGPMIGGGGMADVYAATQTGLDRRVAVKVMKPWLAQDPEFVSRFAREARVCAKLMHPHVVQVYGIGSHEGRPCLVMELLEGRTLADALEEHLMAVEDIIAIIQQVLQGLSAAHVRGVVHRDVKPGNVFLCDSGDVKVMDFGIALASDTTPLTSTGSPIGTPEYMSPEQVEGKKVDARSDIYAVGVLLYKMLTGETPFKAETPIAILLMHVSKPPPELPPYIPAWLREVVLKALAKKPEDRYSSAKEMLAAMEAKTVSSPANPPARPSLPAGSNLQWVPSGGYESVYSGHNSLPEDSSRTDARRTMAVVAALVAVMLLACAAGYGVMRSRTGLTSPAAAVPAAAPAISSPGPSTMTAPPDAPSATQPDPQAALPPPQSANDNRAGIPNGSLYGRSPLISDDAGQSAPPAGAVAPPPAVKTPAQNPAAAPSQGTTPSASAPLPSSGAPPSVPAASPPANPNFAPASGGFSAPANPSSEPGSVR
jgi:serine/threonine-protein kinase